MMRRFALIAVLACSTLVLPSSAQADQPPIPGPPGGAPTVSQKWQIGSDLTSSSSTLVPDAWAGVCVGEFVNPQYSASNHTLHWGGEQSCTTPMDQTLTLNLFKVVGSGDRETYSKIATGTFVGVAWQAYVQKYRNCSGTVSTRWIENAYGEADGHLSVPYPAWSSVVSAPCG